MLVLSRKPGEKLVIGSGIVVTVLGVRGNQVKVGIQAPDDVVILRSELDHTLDADAHTSKLATQDTRLVASR